MKRILAVFLLGMSLGLYVCSLMPDVGYQPPEPVVVTKYIPSPPVEIIKEVETRIIEAFDVPEYIYLDEPRLFKDKVEVGLFVARHYSEVREYSQNQGYTSCVDYTLAWQRFALKKGYLISTENDIDRKTNKGHTLLAAFTEDGNCVYWDYSTRKTWIGAIRGDK